MQQIEILDLPKRFVIGLNSGKIHGYFADYESANEELRGLYEDDDFGGGAVGQYVKVDGETVLTFDL